MLRISAEKLCIHSGVSLSTHLSSLAFSSSTPSLYASPSNAWARQCTLVVLPIPGSPCVLATFTDQYRSRSGPDLILGHYHSITTHADQQMRAIAVLRDDLEPVDGGLIPNDVVQLHRPVLLDPGVGTNELCRVGRVSLCASSILPVLPSLTTAIRKRVSQHCRLLLQLLLLTPSSVTAMLLFCNGIRAR